MVPSMKAIGQTIEQMVKENLFLLMEIYMMVIGWMINRLGREFILKKVVLFMKESGRMTSSLVMGQKYGIFYFKKKLLL